MKWIIAGPRFGLTPSLVLEALNLNLDPSSITEIVSGRARGVDRLGESWATSHGIKIKPFPVTPQLRARLGSRAPFYRNVQMGEYVGRSGALIVVHDGPTVTTPGSTHMLETAIKFRLSTIIVVSTDTPNNPKRIHHGNS